MGEIKVNKKELQRRMSLLAGQVDGVKKMIEEDRNYIEILQQIIAIRSALTKVGVNILTEEMSACKKTGDNKQVQKILHVLFDKFI